MGAANNNNIAAIPGLSKNARVTVLSRNGQHQLIATKSASQGESLIKIEGELVATPLQYTLQIGVNSHIAPPAGMTRDDSYNRYQWRFINHSCYPNTFVRKRFLVAIRPIAAGEEITFDYNSNEYDIVVPFNCVCGHCDGSEIRGYRYLTPEQRKARELYTAEYLHDPPKVWRLLFT